MKKIVLTLIIILGVTLAYGQDHGTFRKDYSHIRVFYPQTEKWTAWVKSHNTAVFNINDNADMKVYLANGTTETYRSITGFEDMKMNDGTISQVSSFLDEAGNELMVLYLENGNLLFTDNTGGVVVFSN